MSFFLVLPPILFITFAISILFLMTRGRRIMLIICSCLFIFAAFGGFLFYSYSYLPTGAGFADTLFAARQER